MSAPIITQFYPNDGDTGIPVGSVLKIWFDGLVDLKSVREAVHLFGRDFDRSSGPDTAAWVDSDTGDNPYFLSSPGFSGNAPLKYELYYYDLESEEIVTPSVAISSTADATSENVAHVLYLSVDTKHMPALAPDSTYTLYALADSSNKNGITGRTIFDVEADAGNTGNGEVVNYGTWTGIGTDTVQIEITDAGDIGTAKYKWKFASETVSEYRKGKVTSRKYRDLLDGIQIRFKGSGFEVGDVFTFNLESAEFMADSMKISFTTNDGSFSTAPDSPSTPASSTPAASVLPWLTSDFAVDYMIPANYSYNVDYKNRKITVFFTNDIDETTVSEESVELWNYPVSGHYEDTYEPFKMKREVTVDGNKMIIEF